MGYGNMDWELFAGHEWLTGFFTGFPMKQGGTF